MLTRKQGAQLARETMTILDDGQYTAPGGNIVSIRDEFTFAQENSILYTPALLDELWQQCKTLRPATPVQTQFEVVNATTLEAVRRLLEEDNKPEVCALNFASAKNPGGGFLNGAKAQEESLARSSALYPCIAQMQTMYDTNRAHGSCLYTDHMIYSPKVPVFRDDNGPLLEKPYLVSFLTVPAVNAGAIKQHEVDKIAPTMQARTAKLLSVALGHGHTTLVLGAWGCGVFKNDPAKVAAWFHHFLVHDPVLSGVFETVVFAIVDWSDERRFLQPFADRFAG